jgi:ribonuclease P protein component
VDQRFGKHERLATAADFTRCRRWGQRQQTAYFTVYAYRRGEDGARLGLAVGKAVGTAVVRNRVKRRLRELFRRHKSLVPRGYDLFVRAMAASAHASYAEMERAWHEAVGELRRREARSTDGGAAWQRS